MYTKEMCILCIFYTINTKGKLKLFVFRWVSGGYGWTVSVICHKPGQHLPKLMDLEENHRLKAQ